MTLTQSYKNWLSSSDIDFDYDLESEQFEIEVEGDLCDYVLVMNVFDDSNTAIYFLYSPYEVPENRMLRACEFFNYVNNYTEASVFMVDTDDKTCTTRYTNVFATANPATEDLQNIFEAMIAEADAYLSGVEDIIESDKPVLEVFENILKEIQSSEDE
ncbi:MAG: YbjN domain-containing protein [Chloroherpetonaceae bacterium]|nr:YbjN domain-containing protein [Chloroherpetonaceae bacterium]